MKLTEIARVLDATLLVGEDKPDFDITRCGASDLMSDILAGLSEGSLLLTGLTTVQVIRTASIAGIGAIVFVRGKTAPPRFSSWPGPVECRSCRPRIPCLFPAAGSTPMG